MHQFLKKRPEPKPFHKRRWVRLTSVLLMLIAAYGLYRAIRPDPNLKKVKQLREEFAQAKDWTPEQRREKGREMRDAMQKLSPSQREALAAEGRQRFQGELERYSKMSQAEKLRHLDEQIARQEKMRQEFAQRNPNNTPRTGQGTFGSQGPRNMSAEEREKRRRERLNNTTPEFRALMDQYRKDMAARRQQWGLSTGARA
jgi:hypothetical protein